METVAASFVRHLKQWNINHVFGVPGKAIVPLILELGNQQVEYVLSRHECGAGYSAAGYATINQTLGVAIGTSGPGGTNLLTAAGQARAYHLPVLFITGHASMKDNGRPLGQDSTFFATDLVKMFEPVTLFSARVERGEQFPIYFQHAIELATRGMRGPVHLTLPQDVLTEATPDFSLRLTDNPVLSVSTGLDEAAAILDAAQRPALLIGKGVHISGAYDAIEQFAERWNLPVLTTPGGKGAFRSNHPLHIGPFGLGGIPEAKAYLESGIDVLVAIGTKLSDMSMPFLNDRIIPKQIIHFDVDGTFVGKTFASPALFIQGDARRNLERLLGTAAGGRPEAAPWQTALGEIAAAATLPAVQAEHPPAPAGVGSAVLAAAPADAEAAAASGSYSLTVEEALEVMGRIIPPDAIVFGDDGSHSYHAIRHLHIEKPGFFRFDDVFAAMGHAIGYAVGAQIADPSRKIVCLTGDGCMFMHGSEISTAVNQHAAVLFIVINNGRLDMVNKGMKYNTGRSDGTVYDVPLDVSAFGTAMGATTFAASTKADFEQVLTTALDTPGTIVIEALVDPEEIPPTLARG